MCGINGLLLKTGGSKNDISQILSRMNNEIIHRGPDQDGYLIEEREAYSLGMAMRRLSIIDLSTGKQPIFSEDDSKAIVFNGEIYNYQKLKKILLDKGMVFHTSSDTEVILNLYIAFGTASFSMLDGMFAFSIYDSELDKVFIARDFFGEKPLYYSSNENGFYWASELKSIVRVLEKKPHLSLKGLNLFFQLTYIPAPFTIYKNIYKLEANKFISLDLNTGDFEIGEVKQEFEKYIDPSISFEEAKNLTHDKVKESVLSRSISDVPLGTFLSGGVDSSIVSLSLAHGSDTPIDTFSIGFEKKSFDESDKSRTVAKLIGSKHHEFNVSVDDLKVNIEDILLNFDEPFADSSSLPTYIVANKTREQVKVALTGDGGDELFGGYNKYYVGQLNRKYTSVIPAPLHHNARKILDPILSTQDDNRGKRFKIRKLLNAINYNQQFYYNIISLGFNENELREILKESSNNRNALSYYKDQVENDGSLTNFRLIDKIISLEGDMLVKVDRTSMLTSLESRAPFLNKELWNFTNQLPENYLLNGWNKKYILKEAFKDYFPKRFLDKSKKGFGVPVGDWLRGYLSDELLSYIDHDFLKDQEIFQPEPIIAMVKKHIEGKEDNTFKVWTYFCFQKWYKTTYSSVNH
ncbi:asparagine synthase (glutamine-hydrolyzing) [Salinimicrobium sp. HB62]|uniref:asparagine synthase (glutamine-hydrolyzing) n=1 Tax=Salinimicrobium sp. HB62 TaxID=3077781 RepID=UPI002D76E639|nr:asparagine synthase (glutamine-hydrolyzing) [Salinimicrobium sp. HB62]